MAMNPEKLILRQFLQLRSPAKPVMLNEVNSFVDQLIDLPLAEQKQRIQQMCLPIMLALFNDLKANENNLAQIKFENLLKDMCRCDLMRKNYAEGIKKIEKVFLLENNRRKKELVKLLRDQTMQEFFSELLVSLAAQKKQAMERMESSGPNPYHSPIADLIRDNQSEIAQDNQSAAQQAAYDASGRFYRDMIRFFAELYDLCLVLSGEEPVFKPDSAHGDGGRQKFLPAPPAPKPS